MKKGTRAARESGRENELSIQNEMVGICLLFLAIFLIFSLVSFDPTDPSFFHATSRRAVSNFGGRIGAEVAALAFNAFGYACYLLIFIFLFYTIYFLLERKINNVASKSVGFGLMLISGSALLANLKPTAPVDTQIIKSGGIVGLLINDLCVRLIKNPLATMLFISLLAVTLVMVAKVSIRKVFGVLYKAVARGVRFGSGVIRQRLERNRQNKRIKRIQEKYQPETKSGPKGKAVSRSDAEAEKKAAVRQPSKIPEETYLFSEFEKKPLPEATYKPPPLTYLDAPTEKSKIDISELEDKKQELAQRLQEFHINGEIIEYTPGPVITTFEFVPDVGVKVRDVSGLTEDLALVVKAQYVRIERILGKKAIGIEIPNKKRETIHLRELLESAQYQNASSPLSLALGKTTNGEIFVTDLRDMPHLLIAGATGSGKSIVIHSLILSILYRSSPRLVKLILIDPKRIEMTIYNALPHLLTPVVVNPKLAKNTLDWAVFEMEERYKKLATLQVRNIEQYNKKLELLDQSDDDSFLNLENREPLPYIVIIIDEIADLMMTSAREIEENIARIAQKARAVGIHLVLATQRPSIDVITGTIKNNFPSRIALAVPSKHDSRTVIDQMGAEKLLGNGDMLFLPPKTASLIRLHGAYVSEQETVRVVNYLSKLEKPQFNTQIIRQIAPREEKEGDNGMDELFFTAAEIVIATGQASASYLQRKMSIGYARAGRLMDQLQERGVVSPANQKNQRDILMAMEDLKSIRMEDESQDQS